jgi:hypothetical protein
MESLPAARSELVSMCADATALFSSSMLQEAAASWRGILRQLLPQVTLALASSDADALAADATSGPSPMIYLRGTFTAHPLSDSASCSSRLLPSVTSGDRTFTVYASAIQYHPNTRGVPAAAGLEDDIAIAVTSLFNMGLCHHLQAILYGDRATACYEKALKAYDSAQRILEAAGQLGCLWSACASPHHHHMRLLLIALTNNVGHVFDQLHADNVAHQQLELLHFMVASLGRAMTAVELASDAGPFAPFVLTTALHPCHHHHRRICPHAPCA